MTPGARLAALAAILVALLAPGQVVIIVGLFLATAAFELAMIMQTARLAEAEVLDGGTAPEEPEGTTQVDGVRAVGTAKGW